MANETYGETFTGWQDLTTSLAANASDLPHLDAHRARLAELLKSAQDLTARQAALTASKQEISKQLLDVVGEGRKLAAFLRAGVKQHYGNRAEKLVEFRLRPFRGRKRTEPDAGSPDPEPAPAPQTKP
jgi:hypothetical protein